MYYTYKNKGLRRMDIWFYAPEPGIRKKCMIVNYHNMVEPVTLENGEYIIGGRKGKSYTLITDLSLSADELMKRCNRNFRNEIRRAEKDGAQCMYYKAADLKGNYKFFEQFDEVYQNMFRKKGMTAHSVAGQLVQLAECDHLAISACKIEDELVAYHVYITGDSIARLLYSVSVFRNQEDAGFRGMVGNANRMLHYKDMIWFKEQGFTSYDWGGYATDPELEGINEFKKGFGGEMQERYYIRVAEKAWIKNMYLLWKKLKTQK